MTKGTPHELVNDEIAIKAYLGRSFEEDGFTRQFAARARPQCRAGRSAGRRRPRTSRRDPFPQPAGVAVHRADSAAADRAARRDGRRGAGARTTAPRGRGTGRRPHREGRDGGTRTQAAPRRSRSCSKRWNAASRSSASAPSSSSSTSPATRDRSTSIPTARPKSRLRQVAYLRARLERHRYIG